MMALGFRDGVLTLPGGGRPPIVYENTPATPVFSARRVPRSVLFGAGTLLLEEQLQNVIDGSPPASCLAVSTSPNDPPVILGNTGGLIPASAVKLLVTSAALDTFGPEHTFTTTVKVTGDPVDGTVDRLYLIGGGDPFLSTESWVRFVDLPPDLASPTSLEALADQVVAAGIRRVTGSVYGDSSYFQAALDEAGPYVSPGPASALAVNEGFTAWPDEPGAPRHEANVTTQVTGNSAAVFARLLVERGVEIGGGSDVGITPKDAADIAAVDSAPLRQLVTTINTFSSNFGSQMLTHHLGLDLHGVGNNETGVEAVMSYLRATGLPVEQVTLVDGSGLSDRNRLTCRLLHGLLTHVGPDSILARSMAVSGTSGTIGERFTNAELRGLIRAKTGTLRESRALAGFAESWVTGRRMPFVFIINEPDLDYATFDPWARSLQEDLLVSLVQFPCPPDREEFAALIDPLIGPASTQGPVGLDVAAAEAGFPTTGFTADPSPASPSISEHPALRVAVDPSIERCDDGQRIHSVRVDFVFVELRYSPSCETMWAKATFSALGSGAAQLHLVGYSCPDATGECRNAVISELLSSSQACAFNPDESGTCALPEPDQVWTAMMPTGTANFRACLSVKPNLAGSEPVDVDLDACTAPAFEYGIAGSERRLARVTTGCRTVGTNPVVPSSTELAGTDEAADR